MSVQINEIATKGDIQTLKSEIVQVLIREITSLRDQIEKPKSKLLTTKGYVEYWNGAISRTWLEHNRQAIPIPEKWKPLFV